MMKTCGSLASPNPQAASNFGALQEKFNNFCFFRPILDLNIQKFAHDIGLSTEQLRLAHDFGFEIP